MSRKTTAQEVKGPTEVYKAPPTQWHTEFFTSIYDVIAAHDAGILSWHEARVITGLSDDKE